MKSGDAQQQDDGRASGGWEKPFGQGLAVSFLPFMVWLAVAFVGRGPHSGSAGAVVPAIGAAVFLCGVLACFALLWRRATRIFACGIGTGLLMFLGLYFTLGMITSFGCGVLC